MEENALIGTIFNNKYKLKRLIGEGGMGQGGGEEI
jgi:hypothetical protein